MAAKNRQSTKSSADNREVLTRETVVTETITFETKINEKLKVSGVPTGGPQELPTEKKRSKTTDWMKTIV